MKKVIVIIGYITPFSTDDLMLDANERECVLRQEWERMDRAAALVRHTLSCSASTAGVRLCRFPHGIAFEHANQLCLRFLWFKFNVKNWSVVDCHHLHPFWAHVFRNSQSLHEFVTIRCLSLLLVRFEYGLSGSTLLFFVPGEVVRWLYLYWQYMLSGCDKMFCREKCHQNTVFSIFSAPL